MIWHLASSNLSVKAIKTALGVSSLRAIFYKGAGLTTLKTVAELGTLVDKRWLSNACPGANDDAQMANLLADRKLSYFKGYGYNDNVQVSPSYGVSLQINAIWIASPGWSQGMYYQSEFTTGTMSIDVTGYPGFDLEIYFYINSIQQPQMTITINQDGIYYVSLPAAMSYPSTLEIYVKPI